MYPVCACDVEGDWSYQDHPATDEEIIKDYRRTNGELTRAGDTVWHFEGWNPEESCWDIEDTCPTCVNIWKDLCGYPGSVIGGLNMALLDSCGMDLHGYFDDQDEHWEQEWRHAIEADRESRLARQERARP